MAYAFSRTFVLGGGLGVKGHTTQLVVDDWVCLSSQSGIAIQHN